MRGGGAAAHETPAAETEWASLAEAGLHARALRVAREDIAFFKYLFESYEGVGIVRTVQTLDQRSAIIAVLATADFVEEAQAILADLERRGAPAMHGEALPSVCREDWFLAHWTRHRPGRAPAPEEPS